METATSPKIVLLSPKRYEGLSNEAALKLVKKFGYNERPRRKAKRWWRQAFEVFTEPMMLLILGTALFYFVLGELVEAMVFLVSIIPIGVMELMEKKKTDQAIAVLDKMMVEYATVFRNGRAEKTSIRNIVPGDLVYLTAGDKIPADGYVYDTPGLMVDESILTGESVPVEKTSLVEEEKKDQPIHLLHQGTLAVQGEAYMFVTATGASTSYGALGSLLEKIVAAKTPLERKIYSLVRKIAFVAFLVALITGITVGINTGWQSGVLGALTLAMSLIPEEMPVVFNVFLILGVWRMAKQKAMIREMAMVETLGSATVICTDKTGTLTEGRMALEKIYFNGEFIDLKSKDTKKHDLASLLEAAILALEKVAIDPIEIEAQRYAREYGLDVDKMFKERKLIEDSSFDSKTKMVHHLWEDKKGLKCQYTVGAPEFVIKACDLGAKEQGQLIKDYSEVSNQGYRVVAVAKKCRESGENIQLNDLEFVGLLVMSDPPREGVREAIELCQQAGIRIIMITGDNKLTAHNIAESINLKHNEEIISGEELVKFSAQQLKSIVKSHDIFARIRPEQKFSIVEALQESGEIVAMTGDGVNDAPALKKANIGVAMGEKGTEVARAAAGIVLLDDNFSTIVSAVKEGRRIYDNLRQAFVFLASFHLPIVFLAIVPLLFGQDLIFFPIHIIFLELICDPAAVLGFEREAARPGLMRERPRPTKEPLISSNLWLRVLIQGLTISLVSLGFYAYYGLFLRNIELGRTLAFVSLVVSQIFLILITRDWYQVKRNRLLLSISAVTVALIELIMVVPFVRNLFGLVTLDVSTHILVYVLPFLTMLLIKLALIRK